jgi:hypothetical protein
MKVEGKKIKAMETLLNKIKKGGLNPKEIEELKKLSSYFLYIAVASNYIN